MLAELLEGADLEDTEPDEVCAVLLPRLQANSGWDCYAFRDMAAATLHLLRGGVILDWQSFSPRRH